MATTVGHVQIWNRGKPPRSIAVMKFARTHPDTTARHRSQRRRIATLVLSVVDTRTGMQHRVPIEAAALHRHSGRYPALCGIDVPAASLTTPATADCQDCVTRVQQAAAALDRESRRPLLQRLRSLLPVGGPMATSRRHRRRNG